jgi:hypothetical protein
MAGVVAVRAADPTADRRAIAFERAMILAGMAALWGVVAGCIAAIATDGAARNPSAGTVHVAAIAVAADIAFIRERAPAGAALSRAAAVARVVIAAEGCDDADNSRDRGARNEPAPARPLFGGFVTREVGWVGHASTLRRKLERCQAPVGGGGHADTEIALICQCGCPQPNPVYPFAHALANAQ